MEIPVINRITNFEGGINSLHNPSFISQIFTLSGIEKLHHYQPYNIWKWGALILALVASFTAIINRIKILIIKIRRQKSLSYQPLINNLEDDEDYDSETEKSCSSSSDDEEEEDEEDYDQEEEQNDQDFHVRGSGHYVDEQWRNRRRSFTDLFSWSEFANGNSVVKLWDNLGLALENNCMENVLSIYDMNKEQKIMSIFGGKCQIPAVSTSSNAVFVSASAASGGVSVRGWDTRVASRIPAIISEWRRPKLGNIVSVHVSGVEKVYVRDDVKAELTVGDMRKVSLPFVNLTESDVDTWWDADAVIVTDESM